MAVGRPMLGQQTTSTSHQEANHTVCVEVSTFKVEIRVAALVAEPTRPARGK